MMKIIFIAIVMVLIFSSCAKSLYSWYAYEGITYAYSKKATEELFVRMMDEYKKIITNQKGSRGVVPPGLYAEYGYQLCKQGKMKEGIDLLKKEIELYPESEKYISRIIKQLEG